jgi:hypothetical protein
MHFFGKEYTQPLQQHNTLIALVMHTAKKKELHKKKSRYGISTLATTLHPPPRQHLNSRLSKSDASKKENSAQATSLPDQRP